MSAQNYCPCCKRLRDCCICRAGPAEYYGEQCPTCRPLDATNSRLMKNYDIITGELTSKRIQLEVKRICAELRMDPRNMQSSMEFSMIEDQMSRQLVACIMAHVASKKYDVKTVRFPKDWWQAFKKQYFPMWALVRWPVQYDEVTMEANAYYPEIEIPNKQAFVEVCIRDSLVHQ